MNKKFKTLGILVSIGMIIFGILVLTGEFTPSLSYPGTASSTYDSGYAVFGADFYNYVCNNSAEAAAAARAAAYNTTDIVHIISDGFGVSFIALGLLAFCFFGMMPVGAIKVEGISVAPAAPVYAPTPAPVIVEAPVEVKKDETPEEQEESESIEEVETTEE